MSEKKNIKEDVLKLRDKLKKELPKILRVLLIAVIILSLSVFLSNWTLKRIDYIITEQVTWAILIGVYATLLEFLWYIFFCKNKMESIDDFIYSVYESARLFGRLVGGMMMDFLLIVFTCMNFNKIVMITSGPGVDQGLISGALIIGILALGVRSMIRPMEYFDIEFPLLIRGIIDEMKKSKGGQK